MARGDGWRHYQPLSGIVEVDDDERSVGEFSVGESI
jgi:hypothetical protein